MLKLLAESAKGKAISDLTKVDLSSGNIYVKGGSFGEFEYEPGEEPTADKTTVNLKCYYYFSRSYIALENGSATLYAGTISSGSSDTWNADDWKKYGNKKASDLSDSEFTWKKYPLSDASSMTVYEIGSAYYTIDTDDYETKTIPGEYYKKTDDNDSEAYNGNSFYVPSSEYDYVDDDGYVWTVSVDTSKGTATYTKTNTKVEDVDGSSVDTESFETNGFKETYTFTPTDTTKNSYTESESYKYGSSTGNGIIEVVEEYGSAFYYYDGTKIYDNVAKFNTISAIPDSVKTNATSATE